jgi:hypothetical protein
MNNKIKKIFIAISILFVAGCALIFIIKEIKIADLAQPYKSYARKNCNVVSSLIPINCCIEVISENAKNKTPMPDDNGLCPSDMINVKASCSGSPSVCILKPSFMKRD